MYGCESWIIKKAECQRSDAFELAVLEKTFESPLDYKEIKPVNPKGNQSWIFTGMTDAKAEAPILWPPDAKSWLIRKYSDAGKDWRQEEKGMTEDETVGWHHWLNGHEFEQAPGDGEGQGSLVCCSPWRHKELNMTEWPNNRIESSHLLSTSDKEKYVRVFSEDYYIIVKYDFKGLSISLKIRIFADKGLSSQSYGFSSSHVWMWELDHKENWVLKNWCFWTMVL